MRGSREAWRDEPASGTCRLAPCRAGGWRRTGVPGGRMTAHGCGSLLQTECLNYIRVLQPLGPGALYVCGTNAFQPACDHLVRLCPAPCPPPLPLSPATPLVPRHLVPGRYCSWWGPGGVRGSLLCTTAGVRVWPITRVGPMGPAELAVGDPLGSVLATQRSPRVPRSGLLCPLCHVLCSAGSPAAAYILVKGGSQDSAPEDCVFSVHLCYGPNVSPTSTRCSPNPAMCWHLEVGPLRNYHGYMWSQRRGPDPAGLTAFWEKPPEPPLHHMRTERRGPSPGTGLPDP